MALSAKEDITHVSLTVTVLATILVLSHGAWGQVPKISQLAPLIGQPATAPGVSQSSAPPSRNDSSGPTRQAGPSPSLPVAAQGPISAVVGEDDPRYRVRAVLAGFQAENPQHALAMEFTCNGVEVRSGGLRWRLALRGYGYGNNVRPVRDAIPQAKANRVEYGRGALTEWYANGPGGLEQGFTITQPPGQPSGPLTVALELSGDLMPALESGGTALTLATRDGQAALRYSGLSAYDATGHELKTGLELHGERLLLRVEDGGARYPIVIDPFLQQAQLTASDALAGAYFGLSLAISGDTVVVGAPWATVGTNGFQGAAYVFVKPATGWATTSTFDAKLTASDGVGDDQFGISVDISGNAVVVGAWTATIGSNAYQGAAYVFVKPATGWVTTSAFDAKLTASDGASGDGFGWRVAISGDTVVVGANNATVGSNARQGAAYVFLKPGTGWATTSNFDAKLTASDGASVDFFGSSVAVSGNTVVVGADNATVGTNASQGAAYVFVEPATGWATTSNFDAKLTASDGAANDIFGRAVAISGNTVVVGAPDTISGAAYVFVEPATGWATTSAFDAKLTAAGAGYNFGWSVATNGNAIVVGAMSATVGSTTNVGAAYVFLKPSTGWATTSTYDSMLSSPNGVDQDEFGYAVGISGDTVVGSAPVFKAKRQGSGYVFAAVNTPVGINVGVVPTDTSTSTNPVTLTFSDIAQAGSTSLTTSDTGPTPPTGFSLGSPPVYYLLTTTATFTGPITVCINYSGISFPAGPQLFHYEGGSWVNVTTSVDTVNQIICGSVTSLSPFALFQSAIGSLAALVRSFNLPNGTANSLLAKLSNAQASFASGNLTAACNQLNAFINEVEAQSGKKITATQANQLIAAAKGVEAGLGCQ